MFDLSLFSLSGIFSAIPFSGASWFVIATLAYFTWLFSRASRDATSPVKWEHLIVDSSNDRASPYKTGYLVGVIVSTWIMLTMADKDKLTFDMFGMYLGYLLGGASWNSFVKNKTTDKASPQVETTEVK